MYLRIPIKTDRGLAELVPGQRKLSQRHRTVLFCVDGTRNELEVRKMAAQAGASPACFDELLAEGFIRYLEMPASAALVASADRVDIPLPISNVAVAKSASAPMPAAKNTAPSSPTSPPSPVLGHPQQPVTAPVARSGNSPPAKSLSGSERQSKNRPQHEQVSHDEQVHSSAAYGLRNEGEMDRFGPQAADVPQVRQTPRNHEKTPGRLQVVSPPSGGLAQGDRSGGAVEAVTKQKMPQASTSARELAKVVDHLGLPPSATPAGSPPRNVRVPDAHITGWHNTTSSASLDERDQQQTFHVIPDHDSTGFDSLLNDSARSPFSTSFSTSQGEPSKPAPFAHTGPAGLMDESLEDARQILVHLVKTESPLVGEPTLLNLNRARTRSEMLALLPEVEWRINKPHRALTVAHTMRLVRQLLSSSDESDLNG